MATDLFETPLDSLNLSDVQDLVDRQVEEGPRLEFKRGFATHDGRPDRWMLNQTSIGNIARDDIAKEVVAFANAYGGVIVIGVDETEDNPKRARSIFEPQIPQVSNCVERLAQALRSVIDPPIAMLELRALESEDGNGVVVVRVGASSSAPHGVGRPPNAYVRRGNNSEPLTMRDMQSMFYERRSRLERISQIGIDQSVRAKEVANNWRTGSLLQPDARQVMENSGGLAFHLSLISSEDFGIDNLPDVIKAKPRRVPVLDLNSLVDLPAWTNQWKRGYRSISHSGGYSNNLSNVEIRADGLITISLVRADSRFHPAWYSAIIAQGLVLAEWLRRSQARPDIEFILLGSFEKIGNPAVPSYNGLFETFVSIPWQSASIGPYSVTTSGEFLSIHDVVERELWDLFGSDRKSPLSINWNEALSLTP